MTIPDHTKKSPLSSGYIFIFISGILWGSIGLFIKQMVSSGSTPVLTSFLRVFFSFVILFAACCIRYGLKAFIIDFRTLLSCAFIGLICYGLYNITYSFSVTETGVSVSAVLLNISPVFTMIFSAVLFTEKITPRKIAAILINIIGCVLTATNGQMDLRLISAAGILAGIGAGICYSLTPIAGRLASGRTNPYSVSMYSYFFATLFLGLWMRPWSHPVEINFRILIWGFFYGLIPTAVTYIIYYKGLQRITESSKVPVIASIETVVATTIGITLYGEHLGPISIFGILLVLLSIIVMQSEKNRLS